MRKVDFAGGKITQNILQTAFPMLVAQIISLLYNIVDRIYIGRIPEVGTEALGAVGLCFPVIILITAFTNLYGTGGAPLFSIELGRKNKKTAEEIFNTALRLEIITAVIIFIFCEIAAPNIILLFGGTTDELIYSVPYIRFYLIGTVFSMICTGMNPYINAQGFSSIGMFTVLIGAVTNIILDPIFIFTLGMGVSGAAIATVISQGLSFLFVIRFFLSDKNEYRIHRPEKDNFLPHALDIMTLGTSSFVMQVTNSLVSIACNNVLMREGGAMFVSAMTIINSVRQILETPILAIADGSTPVISYNYGAMRPNHVKKAIRIMCMLAIGYCVIMNIFIELKPEFLISIFTDDEALAKLTVHPVNLYFCAFIFQSLQYSAQTTFKALGKKKYAIFFSIFRKAIMVVPLTILLPTLFGMGTDGVFMAEPISNLIGGCASFITMLLTVIPELNRLKSSQNTI